MIIGKSISRNEALATQKATMNLMNHMHSFHMPQSAEAKQERIERMRRARSMPKLDIEEVIRTDPCLVVLFSTVLNCY